MTTSMTMATEMIMVWETTMEWMMGCMTDWTMDDGIRESRKYVASSQY